MSRWVAWVTLVAILGWAPVYASKQAQPLLGYNKKVDELYRQEIAPRIPATEHYLDYTGASPYWNSQIAAAAKELQNSVYGNPHSTNPSSLRTEAIVEQVRSQILDFFGADPEQYDMVFTRSGTGALHTVGETFPWSRRSHFAYLTVNHNSVLGMREYARAARADYGAVSEEEVERWLQDGGDEGLPGLLSSNEGGPKLDAGSGSERRRQLLVQQQQRQRPALDLGQPQAEAQAEEEEGPTYHLFAYPSYDNYAGVMFPQRWVQAVQAKSTDRHRWKVVLDAAAYVACHPLNLTATPADFVDISFYKLFGYPSGVGALLIRKDALAIARKTYWGGGSVFLATSRLDWKHYKPMGAERMEDGTLPFLSIIALRQGLDVYRQLGGPAAIERHTNALRAALYAQLSALRHSNGAPLLNIFGRHHWANSHEVQGSTFTFQILQPDGQVFSYKKAALTLAAAGFHMRCGCTCNPGACYGALGVSDEEVAEAARLAGGNFTDWEWIWVQRPGPAPPGPTPAGKPVRPAGKGLHWVRKPLGSLRASLGYMSRAEDAQALAAFIKGYWTDRTEDADSDSDSWRHVAVAGDEDRLLQRLERAAMQANPSWC